jgi:hypothetical protein
MINRTLSISGFAAFDLATAWRFREGLQAFPFSQATFRPWAASLKVCGAHNQLTRNLENCSTAVWAMSVPIA